MCWGGGGGVGRFHVPSEEESEAGPRILIDENELSMDGGGAGRGGGDDAEAANSLLVSAFAINPSRSVEREEMKFFTLRLK